MAAVNEVSMDVAVAAVLSQLDGIYASKEEKKWHRRLLGKQQCFSFLCTGFVKSSDKRHGA